MTGFHKRCQLLGRSYEHPRSADPCQAGGTTRKHRAERHHPATEHHLTFAECDLRQRVISIEAEHATVEQFGHGGRPVGEVSDRHVGVLADRRPPAAAHASLADSDSGVHLQFTGADVDSAIGVEHK